VGVTTRDPVPLGWKDCTVCAIAVRTQKKRRHLIQKDGRQEYAERFINIFYQREKNIIERRKWVLVCAVKALQISIDRRKWVLEMSRKLVEKTRNKEEKIL